MNKRLLEFFASGVVLCGTFAGGVFLSDDVKARLGIPATQQAAPIVNNNNTAQESHTTTVNNENVASGAAPIVDNKNVKADQAPQIINNNNTNAAAEPQPATPQTSNAGSQDTATVQQPVQEAGLSKADLTRELTPKQRSTLSLIRTSFNTLHSSAYPLNDWNMLPIWFDESDGVFNFEDADPTGTKTRNEMKAEGLKRAQAGSERYVHALFNSLKRKDEQALPTVLLKKEMDENLAFIGKDYAFLDVTGKKNAAEMETLYSKLVDEAVLKEARRVFAEMGGSDRGDVINISNDAAIVNKALEYLQAGYAQLDPTKRRTEKQMEAEFNRRLRGSVKYTEAADITPKP